MISEITNGLAWLPVHNDVYLYIYSCGKVYSCGLSEESATLGTLSVDGAGRSTLQTVSDQLRVWDLIGRSIVVHSQSHNRYELFQALVTVHGIVFAY